MKAFHHSLLSESLNKVNAYKLDDLAYTWFGRPNTAFSAAANKYWVGGVKDGIQTLIEVDLLTGEATTFPVGHVFEEDDHNQAQILIRQSDSRILICYTGHNANYVGIRISENPLDGSLFRPVKIINTGFLNSYTSPYQASNGDIFIFYRARGSAGAPTWATQWHYIKSVDDGETWGSGVIFWEYPLFNDTIYLISHQDGDNLHFIGTNGNPEEVGEYNLKPYHFVFDISNETATNSSGDSITLPVSPSNATEVFSDITGDENTWILDVITVLGVPRMLWVYFPLGKKNLVDEFKERYICCVLLHSRPP